jgi:preprotein translocase subunit SecA
MAGRGTDIKLEKKVLDENIGLFVLGTDKAESRRIDNQLRGRSGRQGEPGESQFFISLDDQLIKRFSSQEKLKKAFEDYGSKPIISKSMTKAIIRAQRKIENMNFDSRKQVLDYDDVIRQQRDVMYAQRDIIIGYADLLSVVKKLLASVAADVPTLQPLLNQDRTINYKKLVNTLNNL